MASAPISYGSDYGAEQANIERQRQYAQLLQQQSMQQPEQQMAGGWVVPQSWTQGLAKALQGGASALKMNEADKREKALADRYKQELADTIRRGGEAQAGTPAKAANNDVMQSNQSLDSFDGNPAKPAVAPNLGAAAQIYMQHPATQAMGLQLLQQDAQEQRRKALIAQLMGGQPGTPAGSAGVPQTGAPGNSLGVPPQVLAMMLSGDPALEKLGGMVNDTNKPIALREGDLVRPDANGQFRSVYSQPKMEAGMQPIRDSSGKVVGAAPIQGYGPGVASIKGAEASATEGAKAGLDMVKIDTPQGPRMVTRAQAAQMSGGPPGMQVPRPVQQTRDGDALRILQDERAKATNPQDIAALDREIAARSKSAGIPLQSDEAKAYGSERAKDFAKQAAGFAENGAKATSMMRQLGELETLYKDPNIAKGAVAENISGLKNLAASFGVDIKGLGGEQAVSAITNKMALELRSTGEGGGMPGAMSDADRNFLANMTPNLSKSPEGRKQIIANARKVAQRQNDIARMATAYERKNGTIDVGFQKELQDFANSNPLFASPKGPDNIDALLEKYK